ncbi:MAG: DUF61 family protein [Sulfolobales archaeon]|nr:DUF61 family protein [Sulfolobales archaeon]MCX8198698.1 DUF61 family protein [Sulfolobales archaeon]MDW8169771.1 DUF61 family protein [Desulfurococcaceae archaeon]
MSDKYIDELLKDFLRIVNKHLPYTRPTLRELRELKNPFIILRDGGIHLIDPSEIELLYQYIDPDDEGKLRIPIIIEVNPKYGEGTAVVREPIAAKVVSRFLKLSHLKEPLFIYRSQISELRRIFRTTTTVVFIAE